MSETSVPSRLIADIRPDACLSYANSRYWRGREAPVENLKGLSDLLQWSAANASLDAAALADWQAWAGAQPAESTELFGAAIALREALYGLFSARAVGKAVAGADLDILNAALADAPQRRLLAPAGDGYGWCIDGVTHSAPALLAPVLWSAADLLTRREPARIRQCANDACLWLFIDESKNGTRRWCDMASCGNRAKARRHYLKRKKV